jgi:acetyl esterase/lipase
VTRQRRPARHAYGEGPSQYGELTVPDDPRGVVVVIHGGFWRAAYDLSLGQPLAADLAALGWATWNLEYRRVGNGGGFPETLDDVAAGVDHLADLLPAEVLSTVVALGHSAGGHLAAWVAGRARPRVPITHVVSQAGVLDIAGAIRDRLGDGAAETFRDADPTQQVPLAAAVWCVHARDDDTVPFMQSVDYVRRTNEAGGAATLVEVPGGHFGVVEPDSPAWSRIRDIIDALP